jgi:FHA domain
VPVLPPSLRSTSAREVAQRLEAERRGTPFLLYRDADGAQRILALGGEPVSIGRQPSSDVPLTWDTEVSRVHAMLERVGDEWTIADEHLSRNGSFVNGRRLSGRRRLDDGDLISIGHTVLAFCGAANLAVTTHPSHGLGAPELSPAQRRVLAALCGPLDEAPYHRPRSNREIAEELVVSVETVKSHLRVLFELFDVSDLPQNRKRAELVRRALESGALR